LIDDLTIYDPAIEVSGSNFNRKIINRQIVNHLTPRRRTWSFFRTGKRRADVLGAFLKRENAAPAYLELFQNRKTPRRRTWSFSERENANPAGLELF
jgi:hypothetical protein